MFPPFRCSSAAPRARFARRALALALCLGSALLPARAATFTVLTDADGPAAAGDATVTSPPTLRQAIANAVASSDASNVINFDPTFFAGQRTITLTSGQLAITKSLTINGTGAGRLTISGANTTSILRVTSGTDVLSGLTFANATRGAVAHSSRTPLTVKDCVFTANTGTNGGGISTAGNLTVDSCTFAGNRASRGGGVYSNTPSNRSNPTTIRNSTFSGNTATSVGGGVDNNNGLTILDSCTLTSNTAPGGQGSGLGFFGDAQTFAQVTNSIIAGNTNSDADQTDDNTSPFESGGYNLIGTSNDSAAFSAAGDQTGVTSAQLKLGPLQDNGGPTPTRALLSGSPALDTGNTTLTTDQRGAPRPVGTAAAGDGSDIGAFEAQVSSIDLNGLDPGLDYSTTFTEDGGAIVLSDPDATLVNSGSPNLQSATVTLNATPDGSLESLAATTTGTDISASYDAATRTLTLSGSDTLANYLQVLKSVVYDNASQQPSSADRIAAFVLSDGVTTSAPSQTTITVLPVNDAPTLDPIADQSIRGNASPQSIPLSGISAGAGEDQILTVTATSSDPSLIADPTVTYTSPQSTGSLSFAPASNRSGTADITVTVQDNGGTANGGQDTTSVTFTITVTAVNITPTLDAIPNLAIDEDAPTQTVALSGITAGAGDNQALTVTATSSNPSLIANPTVRYTSPQSTGSLSFAPLANANGTATITVTVRDNGGTANGGVDTTSRTFTVTVRAVNDLPVAQGQSVGTAADTPVLIQLAATDVEDSTLRFEVIAAPGNGSFAPQPADPAGSVRYVPRAGFAGTDSFVFQAVDSQGGRSNPATVTIAVGSKNHAPVAVDDTVSTPEDTPLTFDPRANDFDADGNPLRIVRVAAGSAANGTVAINADGTLRFVPAPNFNGTAAFSYTISDGSLESTAGVTVQVAAVDDAPVARDDSAATSQNTPVSVQVLANDTDIDGPALTVSGVDARGTAGTVAIGQDSRSVLFTPAAGFSGATSFGYTVSDGQKTAAARVAVTVGAPSPGLIARDDSAATAANTPVSIPVLANDSAAAGATLTVTGVNGVTGGTAAVSADRQSVLFTPQAGFSGTASFGYTVGDGTGSGNALVSVQVAPAAPVNQPPLAAADSYGPPATPNRGRVLQVLAARGVLSNDTDFEGTPLSAVLLGSPRHGTLELRPDGSFTYRPSVVFIGTDEFTYSASDGQLLSAPATVSIRVGAPVDDTPPLVFLAGPARQVLPQLRAARGSVVDVYVLRGCGVVFSSGLKSVVLRLQRADGFYFNGNGFQKAAFNLRVGLDDRSFFSMTAPLPASVPDGPYIYTAVATDNAGNVGRAAQVITVRAPTVALTIATPPQSDDGIAHLAHLQGVSGTVSLNANRVEVALRRADGFYFNGAYYQRAPLFVRVTPSNGAWSVRRLLPSGTALTPGSYTIEVRASSAAGSTGMATRSVAIESNPAG